MRNSFIGDEKTRGDGYHGCGRFRDTLVAFFFLTRFFEAFLESISLGDGGIFLESFVLMNVSLFI